jgi:DNA-binding NarL/FixJ family response regulator
MNKILIAEDFPGMINYNRRMIKKSSVPTSNVISEQRAEDALQRIRSYSYDLLVTDLEFRGEEANGIRLALEADCPVVVYTRHREFRWFQSARMAGADAYVVKDRNGGKTLETAIRAVLGGDTFFSEQVTEYASENASPAENLKDRHYDTLFAIGRSGTIEEAANQLGVTKQVLYNYRSQIRKRLGLESTRQVDQIAHNWV